MSKAQKKRLATIKALRALAIDAHTVSYMVGDFSKERGDEMRGASNMMNEWADHLEYGETHDGADAERGSHADQ